MPNFFIYTDGRTGSTAICDEIGKHSQLTCWQELFTYGADLSLTKDKTLSQVSEVCNNLSQDILEYQYYRELCLNEGFTGKEALSKYFQYLCTHSKKNKSKFFGFKALYNHASKWEEDDFLFQLNIGGFFVIHNLRLNLVRKYISGAIATKSGNWNTRGAVKHVERYVLDPDLCMENVKASISRYRRYDSSIRKMLFNVHTQNYEKFLTNRQQFLNEIFDFLEVKQEEVPASDFKIMTPPDLSKIIENFKDFSGILSEELTVEDVVSKEASS